MINGSASDDNDMMNTMGSALRDFDLAYDRSGSKAAEMIESRRRAMSALP
jgi:hypothetical protein